MAHAIDAAYVEAAAAAADLQIPPGHLAAVAANLHRIAELAGPILALPLEPEDEIAPVFRP